jgi:hypothetical protein
MLAVTGLSWDPLRRQTTDEDDGREKRSRSEEKKWALGQDRRKARLVPSVSDSPRQPCSVSTVSAWVYCNCTISRIIMTRDRAGGQSSEHDLDQLSDPVHRNLSAVRVTSPRYL